MTRCNRFVIARCAMLALSLCSSFASAAKPAPAPTIFTDVEITFAGQTWSFGGYEQSFVQSGDGGRIVLGLTEVGTVGYLPLPAVDVNTLSAHGNHWEIWFDHQQKTDGMTGTCAAQMFVEDEDGILVRHVYLNCRDLDP